MSKKGFIDSVRVDSPCTEDWDAMTGNEQVRFCGHCAKDVNNLSEMTRKQALRLVRTSKERICIRYIADPRTGAPQFADRLHQITRRAPALAAGVMTASIALSQASYAQSSVVRPDPPAAATARVFMGDMKAPKQDPVTATGGISGTVLDPQGAVISGAHISLTLEPGKETRTTVSDGSGAFRFEDLPAGTYTLRSDAVSGFGPALAEGVVVSDGIETRTDIKHDSFDYSTAGGLMISVVEHKGTLASAVASEDLDEVRDLIAHGSNVNQKEEDKTTPLFVAAETGNVDITRVLLDFGAKVNARNSDKRTPLMNLDEDASADLVNLLIGAGAKVNLTDRDGNTALILLAGRVKPQVLQALVDAGADVNHKNNDGQTALMNAADRNELENVRTLLLANASVNLHNNADETAWDLTTDEAIEELLVSYGAETRETGEAPPDAVPTDNPNRQ